MITQRYLHWFVQFYIHSANSNHSANADQPLVTGLFVILVLGKLVHSLEQTYIVI